MARFLNPELSHFGTGIEETASIAREYPFALNFTGMAIEAYRRDKITYNKLIALADQVAFDAKVIDRILFYMGLENNLEAEVYLPE